MPRDFQKRSVAADAAQQVKAVRATQFTPVDALVSYAHGLECPVHGGKRALVGFMTRHHGAHERMRSLLQGLDARPGLIEFVVALLVDD